MEAWEIDKLKKQPVQNEENRLHLEIPYEIPVEKQPERDTNRTVIVLNEEEQEPYMGIYDIAI